MFNYKFIINSEAEGDCPGQTIGDELVFDSSSPNCTVEPSKDDNYFVYSTRIIEKAQHESVINRDSNLVGYLHDFVIEIIILDNQLHLPSECNANGRSIRID